MTTKSKIATALAVLTLATSLAVPTSQAQAKGWGLGAALVGGAIVGSAIAASSAPYGMDAAWWDGVVARAGALADEIESPNPDHELVTDLAAALRNELRPVI